MSLGRVKEKIEAAARDGHLLYYEDLLLSDMGDDDDDRRRTLYAILDKINDEEHTKSGVWLSSIIVGESIGMPGEGFFRKYRQRFGAFISDKSDNFVLFARLARKVFRHYRAADNYGILIDADHVGVDVAETILTRNQNFVARRAFGNQQEFGKKWRRLRSNFGAEFYPTPKTEYEKNQHGIKNATDFRLYKQGVRITREIHLKRLIDVLYILSCDKGFKHLADTIKDDGVEVQWLDNKGNPHLLG